jgi:hypothetical protein
MNFHRLIDKLWQAKQDACAFYDAPTATPDFRRWARRTRKLLEKLFVGNSRVLTDFDGFVQALQSDPLADSFVVGAMQDWIVEHIYKLTGGSAYAT